MNVRFGIVGIQGFGGSHINRIRETDNAEVVAICDVNREACEELAGKHGIPGTDTDYQDLLARDEVDAVVIATPHHLHHPMAMDTLNAGKHLFLEKPFTIRHDHAVAINQLADEKGLKVTCGFSQRLFEGALKARVAIESGLLGRIDYIRARYMARWTGFMFSERTSWRTKKDQAGGGILIGRGSHVLDSILFLLGGPDLNEVTSTCHHRMSNREVEDLATVTFSTTDGTHVNFDCSYVLQTPEPRDEIRYEIYGDRGGLIYTVMSHKDPAMDIGTMNLASGEWTDLQEKLDEAYESSSFPTSLQQDFADAIINDRTPFVSGEQAARVVNLIETAYREAEVYR